MSKTLDKAAGAEREVTGQRDTLTGGNKDANTFMASPRLMDVTTPATDAAKQWQGWGTALKPAFEPLVLARKPLIGTVAQNVLAHGTGALNIDGCRIEASDKAIFPAGITSQTETVFGGGKGRYDDRARTPDGNLQSRWPANFIHDGSDEVLALFPETKSAAGVIKRAGDFARGLEGRTDKPEVIPDGVGFGDSGSAARFFYCAKASRSDRGEGNLHPTVKPSALMRYLVRLITPPGAQCWTRSVAAAAPGKRQC